MAELGVELFDLEARLLDEHAAKAGKTTSEFAREILNRELRVRAGMDVDPLVEALNVIAHIVSQAQVNPVVKGEWIERYDLPVGSIHKAIPFLARFGIVVDRYGYIHRGPTEPVDVPDEEVWEYGLMFKSHYEQTEWPAQATPMPRDKAQEHALSSGEGPTAQIVVRRHPEVPAGPWERV